MGKATSLVEPPYLSGAESIHPAPFCFGEPNIRLLLLNLSNISMSNGVFPVQ